MPKRIFNFSAGPAMLPAAVLERARDELLSFGGSGMSIMEMSHRSKAFDEVLVSAESGMRRLLSIPEDYDVLFLQGGASLQFAMVPMNFLGADETASYVVTGYWGQKAVTEAERCGRVRIAFSDRDDGFRRVPTPDEIHLDGSESFVHYTSNETIDGVEFDHEIDGHGVPVTCDASSNILSRQIDINRYALIYAGAQKNIGPSGVTVVIIRRDLAERSAARFPILNYREIAEKRSMLNTPNTWGIYLVKVVCDHLLDTGGVVAARTRNVEKAKVLYDAIDNSDGFYQGHALPSSRSAMNVTFRLPTPELDELFCAQAARNDLNGLRGHRSVGGIRASIYNAFPLEGVEALVDLMEEFARLHG